MSVVNISNITIFTVENVDYCCIIHNNSKYEAINLLKNSVLEDRGYRYEKILSCISVYSRWVFLIFFVLLCMKWLIVNIVQTYVSL